MFDDNFADLELLMRQTVMTAFERFLLILLLMIAALTALALLAALGGLLWQRARDAAAAIKAAASPAPARNVVRLRHLSPTALSPRASL